MSQSIKVLIADDEPDILELVQYNLEKEGYRVVTASDGQEAIEMARVEQPDVILLDIMMPELDGVEVCRQLRQEKMFDDTIIAFLTARNEDFTQIAALDVGGDDFISKPFSKLLLHLVAKRLRKAFFYQLHLIMIQHVSYIFILRHSIGSYQ